MITVEIDFDLGRINLDFHRELNIIGRMVREDHTKRLQRGVDVNGNQMTPLADATIERKGFNQILWDTGQMGNLVIDKADKTNQTVVIHPGAKRKRGKVTSQDIGGFHQRGYEPNNLPQRKWFGISKRAEAKAIKMIELRMEREIRRA